MKINKKLIGSALLLSLLLPYTAHAADVVMYDDSDIIEIKDNGSKDKASKNENEKRPNFCMHEHEKTSKYSMEYGT